MARKSKIPAKSKTPAKPVTKSHGTTTVEKTVKPVADTPASKPTQGTSVRSPASSSSSSSSTGIIIGLVIVGLVVAAGASRQYWLPQVKAYLDRGTVEEMVLEGNLPAEASEQIVLEALSVALPDTTPDTTPDTPLMSVEETQSNLEMTAFAEQENIRIKDRQDMTVILNRLGEVENAMRDLKQMASAISSDYAEDARSTLDILNQRLQVIESQNQKDTVERDKGVAALTSITQRIDMLETASANTSSVAVIAEGDAIVRASGLVLAVGQLRSIVRQGIPYVGELSAVVATTDNRQNIQQALDVLTLGAETGVKQLGTLRASFEDAILDAVKADAQWGQGGWIDDVLNKLSDLVVIRKIDGLTGLDTVDARISRAQSSMGEGDLTTVIDVIAGLDQPAAQAFAEWLKDAQFFLATERALDDLYNHVIAQLVSMKG